jgi:hypothetical protein
MAEADPRAALERLIQERGEDYASLSRLIGRNAAYVQQYIKRGTPKRLDEKDRRLLARYFGVPEAVLGGPEAAEGGDLVRVPRIDIGASAGSGSLADEGGRSHISFDAKWLRRLAGGAAKLSMIRVEGDSMVPTLADGDEILVDLGDGAERLRDGIYVLRLEDALMVKRVALNPAGRRLTIASDNPAYPSWPDCRLGSIDVVGRVVWAGRKIA